MQYDQRFLLHLIGVVVLGVIGLCGLWGIFFPKTLMEEDATGLMGFIRDMLKAIPEGIRSLSARVIGLLLFCLAAWYFMNSRSMFQSEAEPNDPFAEEVVAYLKTREASYDLKILGPTITVKDTASGKSEIYNVYELSRGDVGLGASADRMGEKILEEADKAFGKPHRAPPAPKPAAVAAQPPAQPQPPSQPQSQTQTQHQTTSAPGDQTKDLARADDLIKQAGAKWEAKDYEGAVRLADEALAIRTQYLQPEDQKVIDVQKMIQTASAMMMKAKAEAKPTAKPSDAQEKSPFD